MSRTIVKYRAKTTMHYLSISRGAVRAKPLATSLPMREKKMKAALSKTYTLIPTTTLVIQSSIKAIKQRVWVTVRRLHTSINAIGIYRLVMIVAAMPTLLQIILPSVLTKPRQITMTTYFLLSGQAITTFLYRHHLTWRWK